MQEKLHTDMIFQTKLGEFAIRLNLTDTEKEYLMIEAKQFDNNFYPQSEESYSEYEKLIEKYNIEIDNIVSKFKQMSPEEFRLNFKFIDDWCYNVQKKL